MNVKTRAVQFVVSPAGWVAIALLVLAIDYMTGPVIQFPILYLIPAGLAAWYDGRRWGWSFAVAMPLARVLFALAWHEPWTAWVTIANAAIRIAVISGYVFLLNRVAKQTQSLQHEVQVLKGILPVCGFCKKIRDENGRWQPMEWYISQRTEAEFTHTFCPECGREHYGDLVADLDKGS
jgi:hypothetical protein